MRKIQAQVYWFEICSFLELSPSKSPQNVLFNISSIFIFIIASENFCRETTATREKMKGEREKVKGEREKKRGGGRKRGRE